MKPEQNFWRYVNEGMGHRWHAARIETSNGAGVGLPDVTYGAAGVNGFIELKWLERWPSSGPVRLPHFTKEQKLWLWQRGQKGGHCWFFLKVGLHLEADYLLFSHNNLLGLGEVDREAVRRMASAVWSRTIPFDSLYSFLTER